ncbi:MAG: deoxynucleoside kinase [Microgenomates group bacterium]
MTEKLKTEETRKKKDNEPNPRYPYFGLIGAVGVGKSKLAGLVRSDFGIKLAQEQFMENPYLKGFYEEDPKKFSFDAQMFFLLDKARQMRPLRRDLQERSAMHDPALVQDISIEKVQWRKGWINDDHHEDYERTHKSLIADNFLPTPDVYVALLAKKETVRERIMKRGRKMELSMMEKHPDYFDLITEEINTWIRENRYKIPMVVIETDEVDFVNDDLSKEKVVEEIRAWASYYINSPHQLDGRASDGAKLIFPNFLRVPRNVVDLPPGLPVENKRFYNR